MKPTPIIDMFSGNAVVRLQAHLMLQRGLLAVGNINLKGIL